VKYTELEIASLIQIISASVAVAASLIPLHFIVKIRAERQRILSTILFTVLVAYAIHTFLEASGAFNYILFTRFCFIISSFGLIVSYSFFQVKANHVLIGGIFGIAIIASFGTWMIGEFIEVITITPTTPTEDGEYGIRTIDSISSIVMSGFGIFLIARFFWLRSVMPIEPKYVRS